MWETWCSIPGLGRSLGEGKGYPLQYSGLENSRDCIVHRVAKSQTELSDSLHFTSQKQLKIYILRPVSSVQSFSHVHLFATPWTEAHQGSLSIPNFWSLLKLVSIESVMPSNHFILCRSLLLLPLNFPSNRIFSSESVRGDLTVIRWPDYWSFSFNISPSNEYSGLISFRMDWFDRLAVQGTLKSLLWQHSSKASNFRHSALFIL